jgi:hypothetical protein
MLRFAPLLVVLASVLAGCAPASEPPSRTSQPEMTPTSVTAPPPTSPEEPEIAELTATGENLPPGVYTRSNFEPPIRLELDVQKMVGTPEVIAVQFANVLGVVGATEVVEPATSSNAVGILGENEALTVIETSTSRLGGLAGSQVTVANQGDDHARLLEVRPGLLGIDPGRRLWIAFFDTDTGLLAVMIGGSADQWHSALSTAEPVLESVAIGT